MFDLVYIFSHSHFLKILNTALTCGEPQMSPLISKVKVSEQIATIPHVFYAH